MPIRTLAAALAPLIILAVGLPDAGPDRALAAPAACSGEDLVAKMQRDDPPAYKSMLDHFATIENNEGIFWKIEKPGLAPSYLFGTAHVTDSRVLEQLERVRPALRTARALIVEIADLSPNLSRQMAIVQNYAMLPDGETLDSRLSDEERDLLGQLTAAHGMPWFSARRMRATFLALTLSIPACAKIAMMQGEKVLDARLIEIARTKDIQVIGLETIDEQLGLLNALDEEVQLQALMEFARTGGSLSEDIYETTIRLHQSGRIAMALSLGREMSREFPASSRAQDNFTGPMIDERNGRMHERALPELEKGGVFLAVGALHLPGATGLIKQIGQSGFSLSRVDRL